MSSVCSSGAPWGRGRVRGRVGVRVRARVGVGARARVGVGARARIGVRVRVRVCSSGAPRPTRLSRVLVGLP